jgi:hypothetical protein
LGSAFDLIAADLARWRRLQQRRQRERSTVATAGRDTSWGYPADSSQR